MAITVADDPSTSENIITNISELQNMEQQLINSLDANPTFTETQKQEIIAEIKQVSTIRTNLYATIGNVNNNYVDKLTASQSILGDQLAAIQIVENELEASRNSLQKTEDIKNNTQRMIEINSYYGDKYAESSSLMTIIIYMLIPIIILAMLNRYNLLPTTIYYVLVAIVALIASIYLWTGLFSIWSRNNMEYDTFDWTFAAKNAPKAGKSIDDPWGVISTCIDQRCCSTGLDWDSTLGQCVLAGTGVAAGTAAGVAAGAAAVSGTGTAATGTTGTVATGTTGTVATGTTGTVATGTTGTVATGTTGTTGTTTAASSLGSADVARESFGNMMWGQRNRLFKKPDVMLGGEFITPHNPCSFIRYN